ncbi:hypothetical protein DYU11_16975 [Fibrisoma montanum]|uniref:Transporter n=1 Tax=Fibrisoma montanum TaxID=2305895 RepID=A0A418M5F2_9BACT|nr:hypothetical protein [Fibrisoma montanum]RIV21120.1 hypothetical protein DYU11_16975 [Fibrisoma montanum]
MRYLICLLLLIGSLNGYANPKSAWPMPKRKFMLVPGVYYYRATSYWNPDRQVIAFGNGARFTSVNVRLYGEYGLSDRWTLVGTLPFITNSYVSNTPPDNRNSGLADAELGVRYNLLNVENRRYLSVQGLGIAPLYQNDTKVPFLGYASSGAELRLLYAGSLKLGAKDAYFNTEVGYRRFFNAGDFRLSQVPLLATFGWYVSEKNVLVGELSGLISYSNRFRELNPANLAVNTDFRFFKASLSYGRKLGESAWVYAGIYRDFYGRNVGIGRGFTVTSVIRF